MARLASLRHVLGLACAGSVALALASSTLATSATVALLPACGIPEGTCYGDRVNASLDDGGPGPECTTCIQQKNCCDAVGVCDQDEACKREVKATQQCLKDGGAAVESICKGNLKAKASNELYRCMRSSCGEKCGLPACDLRPEVILFANPTCDRCVGGLCCEQINECYSNRRCQLIIECVTANCPRTLGPAMTALGQNSPETIKQVNDEVCSGKARAPGPDNSPGLCLDRCIHDFAPFEESTTDDVTARCLAFSVFSCAAAKNCGAVCARPDGGRYTGEPWPEDSIGVDAPGPPDAAPTDAPAE
jgi:hypothetical protein